MPGAWRRLNERGRAALLALGTDPAARVHPLTRDALTRHGLLDEAGLTGPGRAVLAHRPVQLPPLPASLAGRSVVDVHLPALDTITLAKGAHDSRDEVNARKRANRAKRSA